MTWLVSSTRLLAIFRFVPNHGQFAPELKAQLGQTERSCDISAIDEEASGADVVHAEGQIPG